MKLPWQILCSILLPALVGCAAHPEAATRAPVVEEGADGAEEPSATDGAALLRRALAAAIAGPGSWSDLHLLVECRGERGPRSLEVFGSGVAVWQGRKQFHLAADEISALLTALQKADFAGLRERYGGSGPPEPGPREGPPGAQRAVVVTCLMEIRLNGIGKQVAQLEKGEQSKEFRRLADDVLDFCREKGERGVGATDLRDGLSKVAGGELAPETLSLVLNRRPEPGAAAGREAGFLLRVSGARATTRLYRSVDGYADPLELELGPGELESLARSLAAADPASLPVNLWASEYTDLSIALLGHRVSLQARQFGRLTPTTHGELQERFDRLFEALHELHLRVLADGRPPDRR